MVLENTSCWFKRAVESLRSVVNDNEKESSSSTLQIGSRGWITPEFAEFAVSALNYPAKKAGEKSVPTPPSRKKKSLSTSSKSNMMLQGCETSTIERSSMPGDLRRKRSRSPLDKASVKSSPPDIKVEHNYAYRETLNDKSMVGGVFKMQNYLHEEQFLNLEHNYAYRGALNHNSMVGAVFKMRNYLHDEQFLNLELPKLIEEKKRVSDVDIDLAIHPSELQKVQLVAWTRFRSLYHSGKIHIRILNSRESSPMILVCIIYYLHFD